jgi:hypothetical protein
VPLSSPGSYARRLITYLDQKAGALAGEITTKAAISCLEKKPQCIEPCLACATTGSSIFRRFSPDSA